MSQYFLDRDFYRDRTPRLCAVDLLPAVHRVTKAAKDGRPDKSSGRPLCDACARQFTEQKAA